VAISPRTLQLFCAPRSHRTPHANRARDSLVFEREKRQNHPGIHTLGSPVSTRQSEHLQLFKQLAKFLYFELEHGGQGVRLSVLKCQLAVHQPWAWAILHAGKTVENRGWPTRYRGPLLIHASKTRSSYDREAKLDWLKLYGVALRRWEELTAGALVGVVDLVDCLPVAQVATSPWVEGPVCWVLANPRPFPNPVLWRGMQGLFDVKNQ